MSVSRFVMEVVVAILTFALGAVVAFGSREFGIGWGPAGPQGGYFPFYVGLIMCAASLAVALQAFVTHRPSGATFLTPEQVRRLAVFFGPVVAFAVASAFLGLYVGAALYLVGVMRFQGRYPWWLSLLVGVGTAVIVFVLFEKWLLVPLLKGPLEDALGLY
ncbi:MAG: tripartite tricarboxylate transporter TctB family protein [Pararhizobium sp.]